MNNLYSIDYKDIISFSKDTDPSLNSGEFEQLLVQNNLIGKYREKIIKSNNYEIRDVSADLNRELRINFLNNELSESFNICMCIGSSYEVAFDTHKLKVQLPQSKYHFNYVPDNKYQLNIFKQVHSIHIAVENSYFSNLLNSLDINPTDLLRKFSRREPLSSVGLFANASMKQSFLEIFNNPLTGKLKELFIEAKVLEIMSVQLSQIIKSEHSPKNLQKKEVELFYNIKEFLDNSLAENHSLQDLSTNFGINIFKLKKGFREVFGMPIFNYLLKEKMELSRKLILGGGLKVNEVAVIVGYKNSNHFSTAFKKQFGINPTAIKR